jgi:hypothetical protein
MMQEFIEKMTGWKATDKDMKCKDIQFVLGEWQECEGDLVECKNGFHFCEYPSGPWAHYSEPGTRIWKVEAEQVLVKKREPGAALKRVARRLRLIEEVLIRGDQNTGDFNTGNRNAGDCNTGHQNTGDRNTGHQNTEDCNTGNRNAGYGNTGHCNTGNRNTGHRNTGLWNTGNRNAGHGNTGDCNTGDWNATDRCSGVFCIEPQLVKSFDVQTELTYDQFLAKYPESHTLGLSLMSSEPIPFEPYKNIPGITPEKLLALHTKHLEARK